MFFGPHLLEADDGRCRQTWRVADEGRQHFLEVAGRDSLQVEDGDQHLKALRSPRVSRQDRWRVSDALAFARCTVAHPRLANGDRADAGHDVALWKMAMTHHALMALSVLRSACFARNSATSASTAWVSSARAPLRRTSVKESVKTPGWASLITLLSDTAYPSFIGEVEALNTTTIRRLIPSARHQLPAIAPNVGFGSNVPVRERGREGLPSGAQAPSSKRPDRVRRSRVRDVTVSGPAQTEGRR